MCVCIRFLLSSYYLTFILFSSPIFLTISLLKSFFLLKEMAAIIDGCYIFKKTLFVKKKKKTGTRWSFLSSFLSKISQLSRSRITGSYYELTNSCSKDPFCKVWDLKHYKKSPLRVVFLLNLSLETDPVLRSTLWFLVLEKLPEIARTNKHVYVLCLADVT